MNPLNFSKLLLEEIKDSARLCTLEVEREIDLKQESVYHGRTKDEPKKGCQMYLYANLLGAGYFSCPFGR